MGSFIVTVVGENPEQQMLKYSSASSPELPNPYMLMHDITEKLKSEIPTDFNGSMSEYLRAECEYLCINELQSIQEINIYNEHINGYFTVDSLGHVDKVFERKNLNAECDGFVLGGGWSGFYFIKDGCSGLKLGIPRRGTEIRLNTSDMILKGSIDFERMMKEAGEYAAKHYDAFYALAAKHNNYLGDAFETEFWAEQNKGTFPMYASSYDYNQERHLFVRIRELYAISSYAFIINGEINKKPHSIGPLSLMDELLWLESVWSKLFSLPDDTVFALYQCHE